MAKFTLKINQIIRNDDQTIVNFVLFDGKTKLDRSLGLEAGAKAEAIRAELKKYLDTFIEDNGRVASEKAKEEKALKNKKETDTLKEELEGAEIK